MILLLAPPFAAAQNGAPSPEELFSYSVSDATPNDVAITADGSVAAAVFSDGSSSNDGEICAWNLAEAPRSNTPKWGVCADPNEGALLAPEGMGVVEAHPTSSGADTFIAAGREGTSGDSLAEIYVYSLGAGSESGQDVTYPSGTNPPSNAVQELWFLDGRTLLAWHQGALSLLTQRQGTQFQETQDGRWTPGQGETIQDVTVSGDGSRVLVSISQGTTESTIDLRLFEVDNGALTLVSNPIPTERTGTSNVIGLDEDGDYAVLATDKPAVFYYQIFEENLTSDDANDRDYNFSANPYGTGLSAAPTAIALSPNGERFAVGLTGGDLVLFDQTGIDEDGPRAAPQGTADTGQGASELTFVEGGRQLFATDGALYAFHARQFDEDRELRPIWVVGGIQTASFTSDGQRFIGAGGGQARAFQQSYTADVALEGPSQVEPGASAALTVNVTNTGSTLDTYTLSADGIPSSWSRQFEQPTIELLPGESGEVQLNVTPARDQAPTTLQVTVQALSGAAPADGKVAGEASHDLTVPTVYGARLDVDTSRVEVRQGEPAQLDVQVTNTGNTRTPIELDVDDDEGWGVTIDGASGSNAEVTLDAGANQTLNVELSIPQDASEGSTNQITLTAQATEGGSAHTVEIELLVNPSYGGTVSGPTDVLEVEPSDERTVTLTVQNTGNTPDTFTLKAYSNATDPNHLWRADLGQTSLDVPGQGSSTTDLTVNVPRGAVPGEGTDVVVTLRSSTTSQKVDQTTITFEVPEETDDSPLGILAAPLAVGLAALAARRRTR